MIYMTSPLFDGLRYFWTRLHQGWRARAMPDIPGSLRRSLSAFPWRAVPHRPVV